MRIRHLIAAALSLGLFINAITFAADTWPQWGGPDRDFSLTQTKPLLKKWPADGPTKLWQRELGDGYATIVGDGNMLYTMYRNSDGKEAVIALSALTGKTEWEYAYDAPFLTRMEPDEDKKDENGKPVMKESKQSTEFGEGPASTPLLVDGRLYTIGFTNKMHCLDAKTGKLLWKKDLYQDGWGSFVYFGYSASPIAYKDTVIALAGSDGHAVVALDQKTGDIRWQSGDNDVTYSSPALVTVDGLDHLIVFCGDEVLGMSPQDGKIHWKFEYKNRFGTAICTPIPLPNNMVYIVCGGDALGGKAIKLKRDGDNISYEDVWQNTKLSGGLNNAVRIGDRLYGPGGGRKPFMVAVDIKTGEIAWRQRDMPKIKALAVDKHLIVLDENGNLMLAKPNDDGLETISQTKISEKRTWSAPSLIDGILYVRDRETIAAYDLRDKPKA